MKLGDIRPHHVALYMDKRSAKVVANHEKAVMSAMFTQAIRWGWVDDNPCKHVRRHSEKPRERYITDAEYEAVWVAASPPVALAMDWSYITSRRQGTVLAFQWRNIDEDGMLIQPSKGGKAFRLRRTAIMEELLERSRQLPGAARSIYLIHNGSGQPYTSSGFRTLFQKTLKWVEVANFHFHDIRGKSLTDYEARGEDAQLLAGHRSPEQTRDYIKQIRIHEIDPNSPDWRGTSGGEV